MPAKSQLASSTCATESLTTRVRSLLSTEGQGDLELLSCSQYARNKLKLLTAYARLYAATGTGSKSSASL